MEYTGATAAKSKEDKGWQGWPRKDFREVLNAIIWILFSDAPRHLLLTKGHDNLQMFNVSAFAYNHFT
ncbi:MAG: hypothetical protein ICV84_01780 [Flavisolibacter sp.]|nr:hypothetical protein [Flavisolibacter sp.]